MRCSGTVSADPSVILAGQHTGQHTGKVPVPKDAAGGGDSAL